MMKIRRLLGLWLTAALIATNAGIAQAAPSWTFKGQKQWYLPDGRSFAADYAEQAVGDDRLTLLFDRETRRWLMLFTYNGDKTLYHSTSKAPELFVRTLDSSGRGRYDSDYLISHRPETFTNGAHQPQFVVIGIEPQDLRYLKVGLDLGMSYYAEDKCVTVVEGKSCIQLPAHTTYLFAGTNLADVITEIETRNGLAVSKPIPQSQREGNLRDQREHEKTAQHIHWFEGDWMQVTQSGPLHGGCDALHEIDYDQFPNLTQRNRAVGGKHNGVLAISASGSTAHDHLIISSAFPGIRGLAQGNSLLIGATGPSQTRRIPVFVEQGSGPHVHLRLGEEIPGFAYRMLIETNGKAMRLVPADAAGTASEPLYFLRCD